MNTRIIKHDLMLHVAFWSKSPFTDSVEKGGGWQKKLNEILSAAVSSYLFLSLT